MQEKIVFHPNCCPAPGWAESHRGGEPMGSLPHCHVHARKGQSKTTVGPKGSARPVQRGRVASDTLLRPGERYSFLAWLEDWRAERGPTLGPGLPDLV